MAVTSNRHAEKPKLLDVGSGFGTRKLSHPTFVDWEVVRLDIDKSVGPDLVGSAVDMHEVVECATFDAVWSSHQIEHLKDHQVLPALTEFNRVLKDDGFALVTCPDLEAVARLVVQGRLEDTAYESPAGPISALDMLYGHRGSIARGRDTMAHCTGFTEHRLRGMLLSAGFSEVWTATGSMFDLWAVGLKPAANPALVNSFVSAAPGRYVPISWASSGMD